MSLEPTLLDDDPLSDDAITADFRVHQRVHGHRYSLDDVLTAWAAATRSPEARSVLDLGSGIGSVAIMLAWKLPGARVTTVEAQDVSFALQTRNLDRNGLLGRIVALRGDFRDPSVRGALMELGPYDLVTGTPPYFPRESSVASSDAQRTFARVEMRGGVEAYLETAAALVSEGGVVVVCADAKKPARVTNTATRLGLATEHELRILPREGKDPLFSVWTLRRGAGARALTSETWIARTTDGARAPAQHELRRFFGLSIGPEAPSPPTRPRRADQGNA